ncbi:response regulator transcription factor [Pedobacter boryungensis]|uniref:Response regulator n=1 Tax=Pedobacter boryungensis TaxID=869962 RepID=A0ABX2DAH5_9SPHI|nr:response regulator [Pedobacter boryungensis]NQX31068.1 response regulator [Pedobacter boryungensis]
MKKCVFVLEDDQSLRELFTLLLEEEEFEVKAYPTARTFKESLDKETPDIIVMDVKLPDGDGMQICAEVKADPQTSNIPIIMMSAHRDFNHIHDCPAEAFIAKPFDINYFIDKVQQLA